MITELFQAIDSRDIDSFMGFVAADCEFRFANMPAVKGADQIQAAVRGFFDSVAALSHSIENSWQTEGGHVCHGTVTYQRHDGSSLTVPFCNVFGVTDGAVSQYLIFADISALYQ